MFCVECGKETEDIREGLCGDCYMADADIKIPSSLDIEVCTTCGAVKDGHRWIERPDMETVMLQRIDGSLEPTYKVDRYSFAAAFREEDRRNIHVELDVELETRDLKKSVIKESRIILKNGQCRVCSRVHGHYYEAIIQVRPTLRELTEEQMTTVKEMVNREVKVKRGDERSIFITSTEEKHGGIDFYMSDNGVSKKLAKRIAETFGGETTTSGKLAGMEDGKSIYKMTYSVRVPAYERGDFVVISDTIFQVREIRTSSGHVTLTNLETGEPVTVDRKDMEEAEILGDESIVQESVLVSEDEKEVKVLDPDDYKTRTLVKPPGYVTEGDTVSVLKHMDKMLILPRT